MNINSSSQGYKQPYPLSDTQIMRIAPSVFAEDKHNSRSHLYSYIPTSEILTALRQEGFVPYQAFQSSARSSEKEGFTKHMLRLRHASHLIKAEIGSEVNELVLVNSHDGTSKVELFGGRFRFVCCNGLMYGDAVKALSLPHRKANLDNVIEGSYTVINEFKTVDAYVERMKNAQLSRLERIEYSEKALSLKFETTDFRPAAKELLVPRRSSDQFSDLWTTFNVVQENLIRGGLPKTINSPTPGKRGSTRETKNISDSVRLNQELWDMTFYTLHQAEGLY